MHTKKFPITLHLTAVHIRQTCAIQISICKASESVAFSYQKETFSCSMQSSFVLQPCRILLSSHVRGACQVNL